MKKTGMFMVLGILFFCMLGSTALAAQSEWKDSAYNFGEPRFILVMEPSLSYEAYEQHDLGWRNKFNRYPYAAEKSADMLRERLQGLQRNRVVNMEYVMNQIKASTSLQEPYDSKAPGFAAMVQRELPKHVDLILYLEVRDYGWLYEYHDAYLETQSYTERERWSRRNSDGSESSGWRDVPRTRLVSHPAGYYISDSAGAALRLYDTKNGRDVWKFSDTRIRRSPPISNGYDPSGPESMMKRIFDEAFKRIPLVR